MSSGNPVLLLVTRVQRVRVVCGHSAAATREFLLEPGTLVTIISGLLLIAAIIDNPSGAVSSKGGAGRTPLYIAEALIGSLYIWWSAVQGIRERDFTADIPVSIATASAIAAGLYSAAAVVALLLLLGGLLGRVVQSIVGITEQLDLATSVEDVENHTTSICGGRWAPIMPGALMSLGSTSCAHSSM